MLIDKFIEAIKPHVDFDSVKTILDIGSRDLEQSLELQKIFPNATIHAFEPNPESYERCLNLATPGIKVWPLAVLDFTGETSFYAVSQKDNHGASSIFEPTENVVGVDPVNGMEKITVPCTSIEAWVRHNSIPKIDLVWADTQGAEMPVFCGFGEHLNGVQAIATEVATGGLYYGNRMYDPTQYEDLKKFLGEHGFTEVAYDQPWPLERDCVFARVKNEKP